MGPDPLFLEFQSALAGRYSLERELGRGGMGVVYLAREVRLDRLVAIKLLPPGLASQHSLRERFQREARTAAKLSHPNIVPIYAVDEVGEFTFYAMAFVDGETLTMRVRRRGPVSPADATRILREVAWALGYAHGQGVVHRDVKPDNILLESGSGRALVTDFGIAALVREAGALDGGSVSGTPEFMSPEQALGQAVDGRSDLYALGAVGYFAVSGRLLFDGKSSTEVLAKQIAERHTPLAEVADAVPRRLGQVIEHCLHKDPADRPAGADAVAERLGVALEQRRELPVALRWFVKTGARLSGVGAFAYLVFGLPILTSLGAAVGEGSGALLGFAAGVTIVPFAAMLARAHRFLRSGFDQADLGAAFRREIEESREEREYEFGRQAGPYERITRLLGAGGLSIGILAMIISATTPWPIVRELYGEGLTVAMVLGFTGGATASVLYLYRLNRRIDLDTRIWSRLWTGRVGRWLLKLAWPFVRKRELAPGATYRATELALSLAAEKLYQELPRQTRRRLADLPDTVRKLEQDAQRMRARLEQLNDAIGDPNETERGTGDGGRAEAGSVEEGGASEKRDRVLRDLMVEREAVQRRLAEAVAALEAIRLNLLKLHAGSTTVETLTTDLGQAQEVAREIDLLLQGGREVDDLLGPTNEPRPA